MGSSTVSRGVFSVVLALFGLAVYAQTLMFGLAAADPGTGRPAGCWVMLNDVFRYYGDFPLRRILRFLSLDMMWNAFVFWGLAAVLAIVRACAARRYARGSLGWTSSFTQR